MSPCYTYKSMKILRQVALYFQEGGSDKVYEVDLCEVSSDSFVVNFRYGRRGTPLRDGTKTPLAVDRAKAEKIYDALVNEKRSKGYREAGEAAAGAPRKKAAAVSRAASTGQAEELVLQRFDAKLKDPELDKLIWRCGERRLAAALPRLLTLLPQATSPLRRYNIAWACGRIGERAALPALEKLTTDNHPPTAWIAANARLLLLGEEERLEEARARARRWPAAVTAALEPEAPPEPTDSAFTAWAQESKWECLQELYLADVIPGARRMLLQILATAPVVPPAFRNLRRLFKAAELRCDGELMAFFCRTFDRKRQNFRLWSDHFLIGNKWVSAKEELKKDDSRLAYSAKTRTYLRLRAERAFRKLGELRDPAYLPMAMAMLLAYSDTDANPPRSKSISNWDTGISTVRHTDAWNDHWAFSFVLYQNSPRYEKKSNGGYTCQRNFRPGKEPPMAREEAFPEIWDEAPQALLHLLEKSRCAPVHEFAAKALGQNKTFCAELPTSSLALLLAATYSPTWQLGLRLATDRWQKAPAAELLVAVLSAGGAPARQKGLEWLNQQPSFLLEAEVALALLLSPDAELRRRLIDVWRTSPPASTPAGPALLQATLRRLQQLSPNEALATERAADAATAILIGFAQLLPGLEMERIGELLGHPLEELQLLGARILAEHLPLERLDGETLGLLLGAASPAVRAQGVALLARLPLAEMKDADEALLAFCVAGEPEIRRSARLALRAFQRQAPAAAGRLAITLAARLLRADRPAGLHADLALMLREDLGETLSSFGRELGLRLLFAKSPSAQEVGFAVIEQRQLWRELALRELARLAQHEQVAVRQKAWEVLEAETYRVRATPLELIPALDGPWEDSRERAKTFFRERLDGSNFDPVLLVALCDAVTAEARELGREMLRRHFDSREAATYLLRLAQHPSADIQLFASGLLETHAEGRLDLLAELIPFCTRVLTRVWQGRAAKARVLAYLQREGRRSEEAAKLVLPLLESLSATIAVSDRAACLLTLRDLQSAYPHLPSLLRRPALQARTG